MGFREGQIEYFGKRGVSLLGAMLIRRETKIIKGEEVDGLAHYYYDTVVDKYSSQDNTQVLAVVTAILSQVKIDFPDMEEVMIGSDNASCFASHDIIPYIHCLNACEGGRVKVRTWIYTEACTGKNRLDTHYNFVSLIIKSYVYDGNDVATEEDIFTALSFGGGIAGSTAVLLDGGSLKGPVLQNGKEFKATKTLVRETHEMIFSLPTPKVHTILDITPPEIITERKLSNYKANQLVAEISKIHKSSALPLFVPSMHIVNNQIEENISMTNRATAIENALSLADIVYGNTITIENDTVTYIQRNDFTPGWACYPKNKKKNASLLSVASMRYLHNLFLRGNAQRCYRISADRAQVLLFEEVIKTDWYQQSIATEVKIKAYFGMSAANQRILMVTATAIEDELNVHCEDSNNHVTGAADEAMIEIETAFRNEVENEVDMLQRMDEDNADDLRLEDERI